MYNASMVMKDKKFAFALSQLFVAALVIIAVAGIGIPVFLNKTKATNLRGQYLKVYSDITNSTKMMKFNDVDISPNDQDNKTYIKNFTMFFKVKSSCAQGESSCIQTTGVYKTLDGKKQPFLLDKEPNIGQFVLNDNTLFILNNYDNNLWVYVDINGIKSKPNTLGEDLFAFYSDGGIIKPMGDTETPYMDNEKYCNNKVSSEYSGLSCSQTAFSNGEYFKEIFK